MTNNYLPTNINQPRLVKRISAVSPPQVIPINYDDGFVVADTQQAEVALELPLATQFPGWPIIFKSDNAGSTGNPVTLLAPPGQTIDGLPTLALTQDEQAVFIKSDGQIWRIITNSGGGAPGAQDWAQTLAIGNPSGGTSPVISPTDQLHFIWTGLNSQVARNRLDPGNDVTTVAFELPFFEEIQSPQGGGSLALVKEILEPALGGGASVAVVEIIATLRLQTNQGIEIRQGTFRGSFQTSSAFANIKVFERVGLGVDLEITSNPNNLELQYRDGIAASSAKIHGMVRVAASAV